MMRPTRMLAVRLIMVSMFNFLDSTALSKTIYSVQFDYKKAAPSSVYFSGKLREEIDRLCKTGEHAATADIAACSHRNFEQIYAELNSTIKSLETELRKGDVDLKVDNNPVALPYFEKGQRAWVEYRDNQCYAESYSLGEASVRYMTFWDCMARITKGRISDLKSTED
ncbi:lysozyme inhibitor LprI family protein [Paraburkholderia sp. 32]|uniref:lysozyme inhibitor LprI family protein n=1 Tax=unclassified Paraburkholderia TaxID=2615204 RepID=UPI003D1A554F